MLIMLENRLVENSTAGEECQLLLHIWHQCDDNSCSFIQVEKYI